MLSSQVLVLSIIQPSLIVQSLKQKDLRFLSQRRNEILNQLKHCVDIKDTRKGSNVHTKCGIITRKSFYILVFDTTRDAIYVKTNV